MTRIASARSLAAALCTALATLASEAAAQANRAPSGPATL
jgi:hypothetical protein